MYIWLYLLILVLGLPHVSRAVIEYKNWAFHFPANSNMGIFIALALPIETGSENVFLAYSFEANYLLPGNESETVEFPPLVTNEESRNAKKIDRAKVYRAIETKLKTYKYPGRDCLLRIICEVATSYFVHDGILGDLIHILFTPSSSVNEDLHSVYLKAEKYGKSKNRCNLYEKKCLTSFSDIISWISSM